MYNDEFVSFGTYTKDAGNPLDSDELLLKVVDDHSQSDLISDKTTFTFKNSELHFEREVNGDMTDPSLNHAIASTKLDGINKDSWTESLFYGLGNKSV